MVFVFVAIVIAATVNVFGFFFLWFRLFDVLHCIITAVSTKKEVKNSNRREKLIDHTHILWQLKNLLKWKNFFDLRLYIGISLTIKIFICESVCFPVRTMHISICICFYFVNIFNMTINTVLFNRKRRKIFNFVESYKIVSTIHFF